MNIYLVVLLIIAIIVLSNLLMFTAVRGSKGTKFDWLNNTKGDLSNPCRLGPGRPRHHASHRP